MTRVRIPLYALVYTLLCTACASVDEYPRRACIYDSNKRFVTGTIVEKRDDGARLFRYDDRSQGDHGYQWIADDDRSLAPCRAADPMSAGAEEREPH